MGGGVDRWFLILAALFTAFGGVMGMLTLKHGRRSRWTLAWMALGFVCLSGFLWVRGEARGACPLAGSGEVLAFLAWSLTLFYLVIGPAYRLSLLGVFSAPLITAFLAGALAPGLWVEDPQPVEGTNGWQETHSAMSVLGYGGLALAAVAAVMFLVLDKQLKGHRLSSGLFRNLPPIRELLISIRRLLWAGWLVLSVGIVAGFRMPHGQDVHLHLLAALGVWLGYALLIGVAQFRGLAGRHLSIGAVGLFIVSLSVFVFI